MPNRRQPGRMTDARYLIYLHAMDQPIPTHLFNRVFQETQA